MALTVLSVAYPLAPVGPSTAGGAEQVVRWLDAALIAAGHRSIVLAAEGSSVMGELWTIPGTGERLIDQQLWGEIKSAQRRALRQIVERSRVDLIHMHGIDFCSCLPEAPIPVLATLHLPLEFYPKEIFHLTRPDIYINCVSRTQQKSIPQAISIITAIENGVPTEELATSHKKRGFAAALGRICPEKGFHIALNAAKHARVSLFLAGKLFRYQAHERYFAKQIVPRLDQRRRFIGPVGRIAKRWLLSSAQCLLVPSMAPETSSLVSMEALACGTPVIALRTGALPEIIEHGRTGFIVDDESEMAEAIPAARDLDPEVCRQVARERFSVGRMTAAYLALYEQLITNANRRGDPPEDSPVEFV